ncbi:DUF952 domain-containing protein [Robertmurraya massiliosenegalensis]|uniref:DUF952 domain-containing protein n=1 Tax=Robertmurraya massiliosenegalensis TaxID=1287657 RepID=UPI0003141C6D|nr:DUF952 domain-containing protein [Robertmurraya massiliosenegalensis]
MILHIMNKTDWSKAQEGTVYSPSSLNTDGFIHCSTKEQVLGVANFLFQGQEGLVLLCIDSKRVKAEVIYEDLYESGKLFPHIYGPLNIDAVERVIDFPANKDGDFEIPMELE